MYNIAYFIILMDIENELNDDWINKFDKMDKLYEDFYKDDLYYTNLKFIYINKNNEIEKINQETFLMTTPNKILREEILQILKKSLIDNNRQYSLLSILKYNVTLDVDDIKNFILYSNADTDFLTTIKHIDEITYEKSISMLQDLNDLIFLFYEKSKEIKKSDSNTSTKKIRLHSNTHKNTIKKQYKD